MVSVASFFVLVFGCEQSSSTKLLDSPLTHERKRWQSLASIVATSNGLSPLSVSILLELLGQRDGKQLETPLSYCLMWLSDVLRFFFPSLPVIWDGAVMEKLLTVIKYLLSISLSAKNRFRVSDSEPFVLIDSNDHNDSVLSLLVYCCCRSDSRRVTQWSGHSHTSILFPVQGSSRGWPWFSKCRTKRSPPHDTHKILQSNLFWLCTNHEVATYLSISHGPQCIVTACSRRRLPNQDASSEKTSSRPQEKWHLQSWQ